MPEMVSRWRWAWDHAGSLRRETAVTLLGGGIWYGLAKHFGWHDVTPEVGAISAAILSGVLVWTVEFVWHFSISGIAQKLSALGELQEANALLEQRLEIASRPKVLQGVPEFFKLGEAEFAARQPTKPSLTISLAQRKPPISDRIWHHLVVTSKDGTAENVQATLEAIEPQVISNYVDIPFPLPNGRGKRESVAINAEDQEWFTILEAWTYRGEVLIRGLDGAFDAPPIGLQSQLRLRFRVTARNASPRTPVVELDAPDGTLRLTLIST